MALVMLGAVLNFFRLGHSIDRILKDNYKSVIAAQDMKETLERQDSAATFFLAGQTHKARTQYEANWPRFEQALDIEAHNITERGEQELSEAIKQQFAAYRQATEALLYANPPMTTEQARAYYFSTLEPEFQRLKQSAQDVLALNQEAIVRADARAKVAADRASWMGVGITFGALLLAVVFARQAINASLTPLLALTQGAEEIGAGQLERRIELHRTDEIGTLAQAFNDMAQKLSAARQIEQQRLHRAEKMSDAALESLYDPVIVTDAEGHVVHLNHAAEGLFGAAESAVGLPVAQVVQEERIAAAIEHVVRQERVSAEEDESGFVSLPCEEAPRIYRLRATPMRDDDDRKTLLGAALVLEDVTHLRELDRLKTEFISVASHELRTPVTSLLLSAQLLKEETLGPLNEQQHMVVAAQREDLQRLDRLMRDLLDITRLESGVMPPHFEAISARELVATACDSVAAQVADKRIHLESDVSDELPAVRADRSQIICVLVNLLNNAVRHTPQGGHVWLKVQCQAQAHNGEVTFAVQDTGTGIPSDYLPRIFDRFVQVPGATRGGAGLGLSIAQTIIKAHGGEIEVTSVPGQGSTFEFTLHTNNGDD